MAKIAYIEKRFQRKSLDLIKKVESICIEYQKQGYILTLRQAFYQMVSRGYIPNNPKSYDNLGNIIADARLAGLLDWNFLEDRTRNLNSLMHFLSPAHRIEFSSRNYQKDLWNGQDNYVEVWVEKEALAGVCLPVCQKNDVAFFSCRGYVSLSELHDAAQRLKGITDQGRSPKIIYLGDHDPSGLDIPVVIERYLRLFMNGTIAYYTEYNDADGEVYDKFTHEIDQEGVDLEVNRIALNMDQIRQYNPPPNPAKLTDTRSDKYVARYGRESWELDALTPQVMSSLIQNAIDSYCDNELWNAELRKQEEERKQLVQASNRWTEVEKLLENTPE